MIKLCVDANDGKNKEILVVTLSDIKYQISIVDADDGKNKEILVVTLSDIKNQILIVDADDGKKRNIGGHLIRYQISNIDC